MHEFSHQIDSLKSAINEFRLNRKSRFWPQSIKDRCQSVVEAGVPVAELADQFGMHSSQIYAWARRQRKREPYQVLNVEEEDNDKPLVLFEIGSYSFRLWRKN